jgi:hypothetical protein
MRTDGRDMTKLTVSFRNFANPPKTVFWFKCSYSLLRSPNRSTVELLLKGRTRKFHWQAAQQPQSILQHVPHTSHLSLSFWRSLTPPPPPFPTVFAAQTNAFNNSDMPEFSEASSMQHNSAITVLHSCRHWDQRNTTCVLFPIHSRGPPEVSWSFWYEQQEAQ